MKKTRKYLISALTISAIAAFSGGAALSNGSVLTASADNQELSVLTEDNYSVKFASIRFTTETDDNSGIRFSIRMDKEVYDTITALDGVTLGAKLLPADLITDRLDINTPSAQTAITYGVGVDADNPTEVASTWGIAEDDATKMETVVYLYDKRSRSQPSNGRGFHRSPERYPRNP